MALPWGAEMLNENIVLPGSHSFSLQTGSCYRCGCDRTITDGVDLGPQKFICGRCWRTKATRKAGALAALKSDRKAT